MRLEIQVYLTLDYKPFNWFDQFSLSLSLSLSAVIVDRRRRLSDFYELGKVIGNGGFGSVYAGTCRETGQSVSRIH